MFVSPCRNHRSSWMIERVWSFFVVEQRETVLKCEAHLPAEHGDCPRSGPVGLAVALLEHVAHQIEVLLHGGSPKRRILAGRGVRRHGAPDMIWT